jgi:hypothetical protein
MDTNALRLLCVLLVLPCLPACAPVIALMGSGSSAMQFAATVDRIKLAGDGLSYLGSGKTITDHAVSMVTGADCHLLNVVSPQPVCAPKPAAVAAAANERVTLATVRDDLRSADAPSLLRPRYAGETMKTANGESATDDTAL